MVTHFLVAGTLPRPDAEVQRVRDRREHTTRLPSAVTIEDIVAAIIHGKFSSGNLVEMK